MKTQPTKSKAGARARLLSSTFTAGVRPASSILARRIALPLLFLGAGLMLVPPCAVAPFQFEETGGLATARFFHAATLLPNGKVLVTGGQDNSESPLARSELYDPASGAWTATGSLANARVDHTATLLANGKMLVAAGANGPFLASAELYDVGLGFNGVWRPRIGTAPSTLASGHRLRLTGSRFQGISQASGGNTQDSSSNYPIVQLRSIDNSQVTFLLTDPVGGWSDKSFFSLPVSGFPFGPAIVTVFTNGIPRKAKYLVVAE